MPLFKYMSKTTNHFLVTIRCMTYNHAPFIEDAMNGFTMQQTNFPYVAIIVDDASTDGEPEVIKAYLNRYFDMQDARQWETDDACFIEARHKTNNNCIFAVIFLKYNFRQAKKSKGPLMSQWGETAKYIAICEGDDYWTHIGKLQRQVDLLENHPECSFCVHDYSEWNQNENKYNTHELTVTKKKNNGEILILDIEDYLNKGFFTKTLSCLYKKDALKQSNFSYYETQFDMNMFYALMTQGNCCFINKQMGCYRIHDGGITKGDSWRVFVETILPKQFSIIKIEKTSYSQKYVYGWMSERIVSLFLYQKYSIIRDCIRYLGVSNNLRLFLFDLPRHIIEIIKHKVTKK